MTRFELNTLETLLRMFEQELEENGTNIEMFGSKLTEEQINLFVENTVNLKYLVMQIPK